MLGRNTTPSSFSLFLPHLLPSLLDATPPLSTTVDLLRFSPGLKRDRHARQNGGERQPTKFEIAPCPSWLSASPLIPSNECLAALSLCLYLVLLARARARPGREEGRILQDATSFSVNSSCSGSMHPFSITMPALASSPFPCVASSEREHDGRTCTYHENPCLPMSACIFSIFRNHTKFYVAGFLLTGISFNYI